MQNQTYELIDSLPGSGKTTAILKYMADNRSNPWLYISPMKEEVENRVPNEALQHGLELFYPSTEGDDRTKTEQVLEFLEEGLDICCTAEILHSVNTKFIENLRDNKYNVVFDGDPEHVDWYGLSDGDFNFLTKYDYIKIDEETGKLNFLPECADDAVYGDVKMLSDAGSLYMSKGSCTRFMRLMSSELLLASNRVVICTTLHEGSVLEQTLRVQGFTSTEFNGILTLMTTREVKELWKERIEFIKTPTVIKYLHKQPHRQLDDTWWGSTTPSGSKKKDEVFKLMTNIIKSHKASTLDSFFYIPPSFSRAGYKIPKQTVSTNNLLSINSDELDCNGRYIAMFAGNPFVHTKTLEYFKENGLQNPNDTEALRKFLIWINQSDISKENSEEKLRLAVFSLRMLVLFQNWLHKSEKGTNT